MFLFFGGIIFALFGVLGCADLVQKKKKCTEETTAIVTEISKEIDNDNNCQKYCTFYRTIKICWFFI